MHESEFSEGTTVQITSNLPARRSQAPSTTSTPSDSRACAAAYYSFRASDCSYQPYLGLRRICTMGTPPAQARQNSETAGIPAFGAQALAARAEASAYNMTACEAAYKSFDPTDCTYQPYDGSRRTCNK
jgi:penicillin-binding protein 1A